jgi:hypothetical protein
MHTCQIMLVEADTVEEAFDKVEASLEDAPDWSDWHNANNSHTLNFAGRWEGEVFKTTPDEEVANYLQYSADPALAERVITEYLGYRMADIRNYRSKAIDLSSASYDPYSTDLGMDTWYTKRLAQLLGDDWTSDSGLYDLTYYTANLADFIKRVKATPEKQWLIPVDFHF